MGLLPLEFTDGLTDSPYFRETLQAHERELDITNTAIKHLIKDIKDLIVAARNLSRAQRTLSETLNNFNFECIGTSQTDDEMVIANSFKDFARLLTMIEDERDRLLVKADEAFLEPIERFRREQIGSAKEAKKKFEKETAKYCQNLERYLNLSVKKSETQLLEADANYSIEHWHFFQAMSDYVLKLQEVNERKKFEFVETVLSFMLGWLTFYHQGHEIATDFYSVKMELQMRLQRTRNNFNMTQEETKCLRQKMLNNREKFKQKFQDSGSFNKMYARQGYLFLMEKKAFSTSWTKHFCQYEKNSHRMSLIQYTQTMGKILSTEEIIVKECIKRSPDSIDRRFCFDIITYSDSEQSNSGHSTITNGSNSSSSSNATPNEHNIYTFQALSESDFKNWLIALDGRDPYPTSLATNQKKQLTGSNSKGTDSGPSSISDISYELDEEGYCFVRKCIKSIEEKGLENKGIYRMVGVTSKVRMLMELFVEHRNQSKNRNRSPPNSEDVDLLPDLNITSDDFETKTITSALKNYLRHLSEPIMTFQLHEEFIAASKLENRISRIERIHSLVHSLPPLNFKVLKILIEHLQKVSKLHLKNLMTPSNLGVCFGPTLLRTAEESVAAILDIKFVNVIAELLIENYEQIFLTKPVLNDESNGVINYLKFQLQSIQQRPLPHVPNANQYGSTMRIDGATSGSYSNRSVSTTQMTESFTQRQPQPLLFSNQVRRSSSQDQLYSIIPANATAPQRFKYKPYGSPNNGPIQPLHLQQQTYVYPTYQHLAHQQTSPRKSIHLSPCSPSQSPSSNLSFTNATSPIYQTSLKNTSTSGANALSCPLRSTNPLLQPSVSYQNLHFNSDLLGGAGNSGLEVKGQAVHYNRPMTSIGIIPLNSTYHTAIPASAVAETESAKSDQSSYAPNQIPLSGSQQQGRVNYVATSSSSLPSTPEHSAQQFTYRLPLRHQNPSSPVRAIDPADSLGNVYYSPPGNQQSIYGTIGPQAAPRNVIISPQSSSLPSTTVRTRYVCIGGSDSELSFQPNMIITNVRNSREPGWLEGNLNGKTGLIPFNYVEFIK